MRGERGRRETDAEDNLLWSTVVRPSVRPSNHTTSKNERERERERTNTCIEKRTLELEREMRRRRSEFGWEEREEEGERERIRIGSARSVRRTLSIIISPPFYGPFVNRPIEESLDCRSSFPQIEACMLMLIHGSLSLSLSLKAATARTHFLPLASAHCNSLIRRSLSLSPLCCASPTHILCSPSEVGKNQLQNVICLCRYLN